MNDNFTTNGCKYRVEACQAAYLTNSSPAPQLNPPCFTEIEVPRSPKILGPSPEYVQIAEGSVVYNLTCEYSGVPTPKVVWAKNSSVSSEVVK